MQTYTFYRNRFTADLWDFRFFGEGASQTKEYYKAGEVDIQNINFGQVGEVFVVTEVPLKINVRLQQVRDVNGVLLFPAEEDDIYNEFALQIVKPDVILDAYGRVLGRHYQTTKVAVP